MFQFDFLRENDTSQIIKKITPYPYVSFDIFDTLLKRDILHPADVFHLVGQQNRDVLFAQKRIEAESSLRKNSGKEEITLDEIYEKLEETYQSYKEQELKLEKALLHRNSVLYPVYEYCRTHDKKIIITSDMYLPEQFLKDILHEQKIDFDFCFISGSCGVKKLQETCLGECCQQLKFPQMKLFISGILYEGIILVLTKRGLKAS